METCDEGPTRYQQESSPRLMCDLIATVDTSEIEAGCTNPAKTVLRPRSGFEYIKVNRKPTTQLGQEVPNDSSLSSSLGRIIFNFDEALSEALSLPHSPSPQTHQPLQHQLLPCPTHSSSSLSRESPALTPQRSPSFSSMTETSHSHLSLLTNTDPHQWSLPRSTTVTPSGTATLPQFSVMSPPATGREYLQQHSVTTEDSIFFPMDLSSTSAPSSPHPVTTPSIPPEPTYVNIPPLTNPSPGSRTLSSSSSHSSASPKRSGRNTRKSFFRNASRSTLHTEPLSATPMDLRRSRSRHSESDANRHHHHTVSLSLHQSSHSSTLPSYIQRSLLGSRSFERGTKPKLTITEPQDETNTSQSSLKKAIQKCVYVDIHQDCHHPSSAEDPSLKGHVCRVHQKQYDKFAESSIIARRRQQCAALKTDHCDPLGDNIEQFENPTDNLTPTCILDSLSVPPKKSSGYKNIDCINAFKSHFSPNEVSIDGHEVKSADGETSNMSLETRLTAQKNPAFLSAPNMFKSDSPGSTIGVNGNQHNSEFNLTYPVSGPPVRPRRHPPSSPSSSPPLSPAHRDSDGSDSPPSYDAPSPPSSAPLVPQSLSIVPPPIPARKPLVPLPSPAPPSTPSEPDNNVSDASSEEGELNYIEVDMSKPREEVPRPPPLGLSRRSKRVRSKREPIELRYAVIDMTATQALNQTRQAHAEARDGSMRKSGGLLNRNNSAPASSKRKPLSLARERKLSSDSIDSL